MIEYKVIEHMSYDWMIVAYFFLGGISAGSYIFSVIANYWKQEFKPLAKTAAIIAPVALALGLLILVLDLGQPFRFLGILITFVPTSALSWGVWFLNILFIISIYYAWCVIKGKEEKAKKIACIGLPFSLLVGAYTGVLLTQAPGRALWHSVLNPVLFLNGGIISGLALVILVSSTLENSAIVQKLGKIVAGFIILEMSLVLLEMIVLVNGDHRAVDIVKHVLLGQYSFLFWIVEIILGSLIPVFIFIKGKSAPSMQAVASMLALIGIFVMRYIVVVGGQVPTF